MKTLYKFACAIIIGLFFTGCFNGPDPVVQGKWKRNSYYTVKDGYIYALNNENLVTYQISGNEINFKSSQPLGMGGGYTIDLMGNKLMVDGLLFDLTAPGSPMASTSFASSLGCTPPVTKNNFLFSVSTASYGCNYTGYDEIVISDIANPGAPVVAGVIKVDTPNQVAVEDNTLFVICGDNGLKLYDVTDPANATLAQSYPDIKGTSVFVDDTLAIIKSTAGLTQYSVARLDSVYVLSTIPVQ